MVTSGFREVLQQEGILEGEVSLDRTGGSEEESAPPGAVARDGVFTGNLSHTPLMTVGARHERHWVQVTPNSMQIPKRLLEGVLRLPNARILSASPWGSRVIGLNLEEMGVQSGEQPPILTVRHGVSGFSPSLDVLEKTLADYLVGEFRVVHFSTSDGQRKGTFELVQAWSILRRESCLPERATLSLVLDFHARAALVGRCVDAGVSFDGIMTLPRGDMDASCMSQFLCQHHLVCCPSRGEGFGLLPLQARACAVPVATTATTGHSAGHCEHAGGVIVIPQPSSFDPIDDGPGALAQPVLPDDIAAAIYTSYTTWLERRRIAMDQSVGIRDTWSWRNQLRPLVEQLRS